MSDQPEKKAAAPAADPAHPASAGGLKAWLPALAAIVLAPAATLAVAQFVLLPRLEQSLAGAPADGAADHAAEAKPAAHGAEKPAAKGEKPAAKGEKKGAEGGPGYHFDNIVVNLAGTMGTRYLKTSFLVTGGDAALTAKFEGAKSKLGDITLAVLSSLTLADLEEPGSKNIIREKLLSAYNQALGGKVADNLYFSDFIVQ